MAAILGISLQGGHIPRTVRKTPGGLDFILRYTILMRTLILFGVLLLVLLPISPVSAHPADMYFQTTTVTLSLDGIQVSWEIIPGAMIAHVVWQDADQNQDDIISTTEAWAYLQPVITEFMIEFEGAYLDPEIQSIEWASSLSRLRSGDEPIQIQMTVEWPTNITGQHRLTIQNQYNQENSIHWFLIQGGEGVRFESPEQEGGTLRFQLSRSSLSEGLPASWESGQPSIPKVVESLGLGEIAEEAVQQSQRQTGSLSILEGLVQTPELSPMFLLSAAVISMLLGALHALSPGHGKTVVAAYLVGSKGKFYHAVALGTLVTLTHTGSVLPRGLLILAASRYIMPTKIIPILEFVSGLLILALGIGLLYPRFRGWRLARQRARHLQERSVTSQQAAASGQVRLVLNEPIEEIGPEHSHDPSRIGYIPKGLPAENPLADISWRSLFALGVSGGLVPCPDAIAILLVAMTINRVALGLSLIIAFSLGLAVVLIIIGIMIVQGKRLFARLRWFDRVAYVMPVISALIVMGIGLTMTLGSLPNILDVLAQEKSETQKLAEISFDRQQARVVYIALDEKYRSQLFIVPATGGQSRQITHEELGILDYTVSPEGNSIIYAALVDVDSSQSGENIGTALWGLSADTGERDQLLDCPAAFCAGMVWHPNGAQIIYARSTNTPESALSGIPSLWWLELSTRETGPVFQDSTLPGYNPQWSPDGSWLSYSTINPQRVQLYHLESGTSHAIATQASTPVVWAPGGDSVLVEKLHIFDDLLLHKLSRYDLASEELIELIPGRESDEKLASWSPDDKWIAFVCRQVDRDSQSRDNQIWMIRPDGSDAHPLTKNENSNHRRPVWSPDGKYLLYHLYTRNSTGNPSVLQILNTNTGQTQEFAPGGIRPIWLP